MKKILIDIQNWFFSTWLGGQYFEFLLWLDRKRGLPSRHLTPKEMAQIIREYSLMSEGVKEMKSKVNALVTSKTKEEYDSILKGIEDMVPLAEERADTPKAQFAAKLREMCKGNRDIVTHTDRAKMIDGRIADYKELHQHQAKRNELRAIRKLRKDGKRNLANKLEEEWKKKYGPTK